MKKWSVTDITLHVVPKKYLFVSFASEFLENIKEIFLYNGITIMYANVPTASICPWQIEAVGTLKQFSCIFLLIYIISFNANKNVHSCLSIAYVLSMIIN